MNQVDNLDFKVTVPLEKTERDGKWIITGVAAGSGHVDAAGDEMLPQAIQGLAAQINDSPVPLRDTHQMNSILEDLGMVVKAIVTQDFQLSVEAELDQTNPSAQYLWNKLEEGKQYGLSVKGHSERPIIEKAEGTYVSKHHTVSLDEISVTTKPYFTHSFGTVLRKAIDDAMPSLANMGENIMDDSNKGETPVEQQESSAPENDTVATEVSPSAELVKSLMGDDEFVALIKTTVSETVSEAMAATSEQTESSTEDNTEIAKAETEETEASESDDNVQAIVKSVVDEVSKTFSEQINALAERIPDTAEPAVLVKSEQETADEVIADLRKNPRNALRVGLAARHGQVDKL